MEIIQLLLFVMIVLTLLNGLVFFKKLIKLLKKLKEDRARPKATTWS